MIDETSGPAAPVVAVGGADAELSDRLSKELTAFNVAATGADDEASMSVRITDPDGGLVAGLTGWTWGGLGGIEMVWVRAESRSEGWGRTLLRAAEDEARRRGCDRMVVASFTFQAPDFYRRHGYVETGRTEGIPGGNTDVHFFKRLDADATGPRFEVTAVADFPPARADACRAYEDEVLALLPAHGGRVDRRVRTADGLTEVHLLSFVSRAGYEAFLADARRAELRERLGEPGPSVRVIETG